MNRRAMLGRCLAVAGLPWRAEPYRKLRRPVSVPLEAVRELWRPALFTARCPGASGRDVLLKGILFRTSAQRLQAFSLMCPHELCELNLTENAAREHPVLVCPCHFSVFDPLAGGAPLSGPATRGAYRFRWKTKGNRVEIREVEPAALG